jgi:hypothetical protein
MSQPFHFPLTLFDVLLIAILPSHTRDFPLALFPLSLLRRLENWDNSLYLFNGGGRSYFILIFLLGTENEAHCGLKGFHVCQDLSLEYLDSNPTVGGDALLREEFILPLR